ncbi:hypothetical protein BIW11_03031 [Tropilaelaps mercedesae]|uniref:CHY-type domain-containing protein n=1 Tax=Tropilaelaps mercedesae TaxID=418985 RepID=A0A1V9XT64_9ACAR|nr:hypothetical protein BIW11_03031 [Tropilaelaps mercedesae]
MGSRDTSTQYRTDNAANETVAGAGVVMDSCSHNRSTLEGSLSSTSANHSLVDFKEKSRCRRLPKNRNSDDHFVANAGNNRRHESYTVGYNIYNEDVGGRKLIPQNAGGSRFQRELPPRQPHQNSAAQKRESDTKHEEKCDTFRPRRIVRNTKPRRPQRTCNNGIFKDENPNEKRCKWYLQEDARELEYDPVKEQYPNDAKKELPKPLVSKNTRRQTIGQQGYQITQKEVSGTHEVWRRQSDYGTYQGQERPLRRSRWRSRRRSCRRGGLIYKQHVVERSHSVHEFEQNIPDEIKQEKTTVKLPQKKLTGDLSQLRVTEINIFRNFPKVKEYSENIFDFVFSLSGPNWPFDVRHIHVKVYFPPNCPSDPLKITAINPGEVLPLIPMGNVDSAIKGWRVFTHETGQLCFRSFLHLIDGNLLEVCFESLRKIKWLEAQHAVILVNLKLSEHFSTADAEEKHRHTEVRVESLEESRVYLKALPKKYERLLEADEGLDAVGGSKLEHSAKIAYQGAAHNNQLAKILSNYDPHSASRKGIEIKFRRVDLSESMSFLVCDRLLVSVQCKKCKKTADFQLLPGRRSVTSCAKCQTKLEACFRPCILLQFNPVLGYLELEDSTIRDVALPRCHFYADCQGCSKLSPLEGTHMGQRASTKCLTCNAKMQIIVDSIKYMDMCSVDVNIKASRLHRANKDSAIQAGKPLPNKGICKHYKKSFRWFRFPCCGKAYACDDCHNEQESDHTAEFASRMICGFCAKEQPFSNDKPCLQCSNFITGKRTTHWEGGKGCRNKTKMSS